MAVWSEIAIRDGNKTFRDDEARLWFESKHADLLPPKSQRGKFVVVLKVDGGYLFDALAVDYLRDLLGDRLTFTPRPESGVKHRRLVRRRLDNVVRAPGPTYTIRLELGDLDALFEPIGGGLPWTERGVLERLQALGYLYTPLSHPTIGRHAELCWAYYKKIHDKKTQRDLSAAEVVAILRREAEGNLLARSFPKSGDVLAASALPAEGELAALRFPGGYGTTRSPVSPISAGDHQLNGGKPSNPPAKYQFRIGDPRHTIEDLVFAENPRLGLLPLIAKVERRWGTGPSRTVAGAPVLFQLIDPDAVPEGSPFAADPLPSKVMNYSMAGSTWLDESFPDRETNQGLLPAEWTAVHRITRKAAELHPGDAEAKAKEWVNAWAGATPPVAPLCVAPWYVGGSPIPHLGLEPANVPKLRGKIGVAFDGGPKPPPHIVPGLTEEVWGHFTTLCKRALTDSNDDRNNATALANQWLTTWASAPTMDWAGVQTWWGRAEDQPYPSLRKAPVWTLERALGRVEFLLREKAAFAGMEVSNIGQKKFIDELMDDLASRTDRRDPQRHNCPKATWGGRAGAGIAAIFETPGATRTGFHTKRLTQTTDFGTLALATLPGDRGKHPHAVQCPTNPQGFAGVLFTPSRQGGDRYRLRAYIDPDWLEEHHSTRPAVATRTGTMVVWRNLRMGRYLRLPNPRAPFSPALKKLLDYGLTRPMASWNPQATGSPAFATMHLGSDVPRLDVLETPHPEAAYAGMPPSVAAARAEKPHKLHYRPVTHAPVGLAKQLRRAYCELIDDCPGVEEIDRDMLRAALDVGKRAWDASGTFPKRIHWPTMILDDPTSPFLLTLRSFSEYNDILATKRPRANSDPPLMSARPARQPPPPDPTALSQARYPELSSNDDPEKAAQTMVEAMLEHLAGGGVLPGFTVIQVARGQTWDKNALDIKTPITSGYGTASRGFYLSHTDVVYRQVFWLYTATGNAIHEMGHALGLCHQKPAGADIAAAHQKHIEEPFQTPAADQVVCVMSYSGCYGDYCGMCVLSLRGWAQPQQKSELYR